MKLVPLWTRHAFTLLSLLAAVALTSCTTTGPAMAGEIAYVHGELRATLAGQAEAVQQAVSTAISKLGFDKLSEEKDALVGLFEARTIEERDVHIKVSQVSDGLTKIEIRIDIIGNQTLSRVILDRIKAEL